jgi:hypothetical protein
MAPEVRTSGFLEGLPATTVHVGVLDVGMGTWRPTAARLVSTATYELLPTPDYDPTAETWEFEPGTVVRCEWRDLSGGRGLVALRHASGPPRWSDSHLEAINPAALAAVEAERRVIGVRYTSSSRTPAPDAARPRTARSVATNRRRHSTVRTALAAASGRGLWKR